jgi:hypothetical protein
MMMAEHPSIGQTVCVNHLVRGFASKPKLETSIKHLGGRLNVLTEYLKKF